MQEKMRSKFPESFEEARKLAMVKDRKLQFQQGYDRMGHCVHNQQAPPPQPLLQRQPIVSDIPEDPHLELLQKVTNQLEDLSINLVQQGRGPPPQRNNDRRRDAPPQRPPARRQ